MGKGNVKKKLRAASFEVQARNAIDLVLGLDPPTGGFPEQPLTALAQTLLLCLGSPGPGVRAVWRRGAGVSRTGAVLRSDRVRW